MHAKQSAKVGSGLRSLVSLAVLACAALGWSSPAVAQTVSLSFTPNSVARGEPSVLAAAATNGTEPYVHTFQWRWNGATNWTTAKFTAPTVTNAWTSSIDFRVRVVDATLSTSAWSEVATLTVRQPAVSLTFTPSVVTQSQSSVLSAAVTNGTAPFTYTYQYRWGGTGTWYSSALAAPSLTNAFKSSIAYRVRTVDANNITSEWASAMLTVMPSEIAASLAFDPAQVIRGSNATLTASATDGYGAYRYTYQWRWTGTTNWTTAGFTTPTTTYAWASSIDFRVRAADDFNATSAWSDVATLTVVQPEATLTFTPSEVVQSQPSVLAASVANGTEPFTYTYQYRWGGTGTWKSSTLAAAGLTNVFKSTIAYRMRSVDANNVTSEWAEALLTVLPSEISASLSFAPATVLRGSNATLTAVATNGTEPYAYSYQWRWGGMSNWNNAAFTAAETTFAWASNIEFRVRAVDSFSSTSAWSDAATLTVVQPTAAVSFSPATVTQGQSSVVSAVATNAAGAVTWQWQRKAGTAWTSVTNTGSSIEDIWPATVEYRARSIDENSVTSDWSEAATLTVLPSSLSASLSISPTSVVRGVQSTLTAVPTNGTAPYALSYQWRWGGTSNWNAAAFTAAETTFAWASNIEFRVRAVDSFSATSEWSSVATLTVRQPVATAAFSPSTVTQSQASAVTASATNVTGAVTWQWQRKVGTTWTSVTNTEASISGVWPSTTEYRVRSVDENSVTSEWATATLTVMASEISASLAFSPAEMVRGAYSTLTATGTNGYGAYRFAYQYRWGGETNWRSAVFTTAETSYNWISNIEFRVRAADDFNSTSAWSEAAALTVLQPAVTVAFDPAVVTQSQASAVSASVTNAFGDVRYQWQYRSGTAWTSVTNAESSIASVWGATIDYRARSVDSNGLVSAWSEPATLTVMPSELSVGLSFEPSNVVRGVQSVLTSVPTNGTAPYAYAYQWRWSGTGAWSTASYLTPTVTEAWPSNVDFRVRVVDSFKSTSAWSSAATLLVTQPSVSVSFSPSTVTQRQASVMRAVATNATAPVTFQWQRLMEGNWVNIAGTESTITNIWPADVDFRARSIDANSVTSAWSEMATLTVMPSEIAMSLVFSPTNVLRGFESVLTSVASNGYGAYTYYHQWRYAPAGEWSAKSVLPAVFTNQWDGSVDYRVQAVDEFNSTSAWALASLTVVQPVLTVGFNPAVVTQSQSSVLSVSASNVTGAVTYQWQKKVGSVWTSVTNEGATITDVWPFTVDYRVRSVDENSVTSDWATATLTVMPSAISASLAFVPSTVIRGVASEMQAVPTNGTAPYAYAYQWRWTGSSNWQASAHTSPVVAQAWASNVDFRVRAVDAFKSTSAWATASLTVLQPQVTLAFTPSTVTQSVASVLSAAVTNATGPLTYQWQKKVGTNWTAVADAGAAITNVWGATVDYRARTIDANSVTSEWSAAATLTVMPSIISASAAFSPTNIWRGSNAVLTASVADGTAPFRYLYEWKQTGAVEWTASSYSNAVTTNDWGSSVDYRVKVIDSFNATSAWSAAATLTVVQPLATASFSPSTVVQRMPSVVSAAVANASLPVQYQWQRLVDGVWTNQPETTSAITNTWPFDVDYRVRTIDANSITSEWSAAATLTVLPSEISVNLSFSPTNVLRGSNAVLTAVATNGYGTYAYFHQWRFSPGGEWSARSETDPVVANAWDASVDYRVQAVDSFNSTSAWAQATLTVVQPVVTVAFTPSTVTQSVASVLSASASNVSGAVSWQWQKKVGSVWTDVPDTAAAITNVWGATVEYRARSVDANSVTSEWGTATLTVLPSAISASLSFTSNVVLRGVNSVMAASPTNGTAPYRYIYEWRLSGGGSWASASYTNPIVTNRWEASVDYRVKAIDSFNSTSAWASASLTVLQPAVTVAFAPSAVTQSVASVVSATATNATAPISYQWQTRVGGVWTNVAGTAAAITNVWGADVDYRARSIDANSVTSEWSSAATLTVLPSAISASVAIAPTNIIRGSNAVVTAAASNGTAPYRYYHQWRYAGDVDWSEETEGPAIATNRWDFNVDYRVRVADSFNSTSAWAAASLLVAQPIVTASFSPSVVTQSRPSVVSAVVTNATAPVTYEWQMLSGSEWTNVSGSSSSISNVWPSDVDYRARSIDANSVTSEWSSAATLTVLPSAIAMSLAFNPTNVRQGSNAVLTAVASNGTPPYVYYHQWRYSPSGEWSNRSEIEPVITNKWDASVDYRVHVVDSFSSTSAWMTASLTVVRPAVTVTFTPSTVTQSVASVLSAVVTNASGAVAWQWQRKVGSVWTDVTNAAPSITNVWPATVEYRARSIDANSVTSDWSASKVLTVMPSIVSVGLAVAPATVIRGSNAVLTATATNGTAPYSYVYEWKLTQSVTWAAASFSNAVATNRCDYSTDFRVKVIDAFNSTSAWSTVRTLVVQQPLVTLTPASNSVVQSRSNVVTANVANATAPVSYLWQKNDGSGWTDLTNTAATVSNTWPSSLSFRARSVDANNVTSEWSAVSLLTVTPSAIAATLNFAPTSVYRGSNATLTAVATNGYGAYTYLFEYSPTGTPDWVAATNTGAAITRIWDTTTVYRVRAVDSFNATSAWSAATTLTVVQATVSLAFAPTQVVHGVRSVLSATVTSASGPCAYLYETREKGTTNWFASPLTNAVTTNEWSSSVEYRVRAVVNNHYTTQWSTAATLTVLAPTLRVALALSTNEVSFGTPVVATSTPTNGTGPYVYEYQSKDITAPGQPWVDAPWTTAVVTNTWYNHVLLRVRIRDSATTNLSYWSEPAVLLVWTAMDPVSDAVPVIQGISVQSAPATLGAVRAAPNGTVRDAAGSEIVTLSWAGSAGKTYAIFYAESLASEWTEHPVRILGADGVLSGSVPWDPSVPRGFFRIVEYPMLP